MDERKREGREEERVDALLARPEMPAEVPRRIAVFRVLRLGDMLCAVPALRALRRRWPAAEITWIGLPELAALAARFHKYVDRFLPFPGHPDLPERFCPAPEFQLFADRWRGYFDLVVQMHGDGRITNGIVAALDARDLLAFMPTGGPPLERGRFVPYPQGHEIERLLRLVSSHGFRPEDRALEFPLNVRDHHDFTLLAGSVGLSARYACIHPGASVPSRCWPVARFAEVARVLRRSGLQIVITGSDADGGATSALGAAAGPRVIDLTGRTSLGALALLLQRAALVITNDTAVSHLASAVGARSVTVISASDPARWAPLRRERNRSVSGPSLSCRPCHHRICPTAHECAHSVSVQSVLEAACDWIEERGHVA